MRLWRQSLSEADKRKWRRMGIVGCFLRRLRPLDFSQELESDLITHQEGARRVYRREFVWVSRPPVAGSPNWVFLPATLGGEWVVH